MTQDDKLLALLGETREHVPQMLGHKLCHKGSFEYFDYTGIVVSGEWQQQEGSKQRHHSRQWHVVRNKRGLQLVQFLDGGSLTAPRQSPLPEVYHGVESCVQSTAWGDGPDTAPTRRGWQ